MVKLDVAKQKYMEHAELHPDYNREWARFYEEKCRELGSGSIRSEYVNDEWIIVWRKYFFASHQKKAKEEVNRLMNDYKVLRRDLEEFSRNYPHLDPSNEVPPPPPTKGRLKSQSPPAPPLSKPSHREETSSSLSDGFGKGLGSQRNPSSASQTSATAPSRRTERKEDKEDEPTKDAVSVMTTLKLLSAVENHLDELGARITSAMGKANIIEVKDFGGSIEMVNNFDFYTLIGKAKEKLMMKQNTGCVPPHILHVVRICIDNITLLMQKSKFSVKVAKAAPVANLKQERAADHAVEIIGESRPAHNPTLMLPDPTEIAVKAAIANTVAQQMRQAGKTISPEELTRIVNSEYLRVRSAIPQGTFGAQGQQQQQQQPQHIQPRIPHQVPEPPRIEPSRLEPVASGSWHQPVVEEEVAAPSGIIPTSLASVNWNALQSAVQSASAEKKYSPEVEQSRRSTSRPRGSLPPSEGRSSSLLEEKVMPLPPPERISAAVTAVTLGDGDDNEPDNVYDDLTIADLTALFKNFKELDRDNQKNLIVYMKKLELTNPEKVAELKRHVHGGR